MKRFANCFNTRKEVSHLKRLRVQSISLYRSTVSRFELGSLGSWIQQGYVHHARDSRLYL